MTGFIGTAPEGWGFFVQRLREDGHVGRCAGGPVRSGGRRVGTWASAEVSVSGSVSGAGSRGGWAPLKGKHFGILNRTHVVPGQPRRGLRLSWGPRATFYGFEYCISRYTAPLQADGAFLCSGLAIETLPGVVRARRANVPSMTPRGGGGGY